ncbi:MAG: hypothetical protein IJ190_03530 [Prevotella sp.]|nr:hypothetical protein [Prevotella sp.]
MLPLNTELINIHAPYLVTKRANEVYYFKTDYGLLCTITFMDDFSIWESGAYQFVISNENQVASPLDNKLRDTIFCIIEAFFDINPEILLYICETGDGKQEYRSRLFIRWFNSYAGKNVFVLETAEVQEGDNKNFAALIVQRSNPRLIEIIGEFEETINILKSKPE